MLNLRHSLTERSKQRSISPRTFLGRKKQLLIYFVKKIDLINDIKFKIMLYCSINASSQNRHSKGLAERGQEEEEENEQR